MARVHEAEVCGGVARVGRRAWCLPAEGGVISGVVEALVEVPDFCRAVVNVIVEGQLFPAHDTYADEAPALAAALARAGNAATVARAQLLRYESQAECLRQRLAALHEALAAQDAQAVPS